jgi:hypothetical protein
MSEIYETTDRNLIVALYAFKIYPTRKYRRETKLGGTKTVFVFEKNNVQEFLRKWQLGSPLPVADIRDVFLAEIAFNSAVHDDLLEAS